MPLYRPILLLLLLGCCVGLFSCKDDPIDIPDTDAPNILLIIADDLGKDALNGFAEGSVKPNTPNIDAIRNSGISFTNAWFYPTCTPTRAAIITGKYGYRTGIKWAGDELSTSETSLQEYIRGETNGRYASAIIGKWHLSGNNPNVNPENFGIDHYAGLIRGAADSYYQWQLSEDGSSSLQTGYITEVFTSMAIDWITQQAKPWFMWLAYTAPHTPYHVPPANMHQQGALPEYVLGMDATPYYMAAIEAMDFQIGRLLENIPPDELENTVIIFLGDNGTPRDVIQAPYTMGTAKGTLYQGGINVPLLIAGKGVSRTGNATELVSGTDLFATIAAIAGVQVSSIHDSRSLKPLLTQPNTLRNYQYSEMNDGTDDVWAISNGNYKLLTYSTGIQELYNLEQDAYEQNNLIGGTLSTEAASAKTELENELSVIRN
ncbi:MAG: sulfatase [Bacteroidetes bacterium]|nr:MAG: sulfatase [Bacteroidota bacterium]